VSDETPKELDPRFNPFLPVLQPELHIIEGEPSEQAEARAFMRGRDSWAIYADEGGQQFKGTLKLEEGGRVIIEAGGEVKSLSEADADILQLVKRDIAQAHEDAGEKKAEPEKGLSPYLNPAINKFIKLD